MHKKPSFFNSKPMLDAVEIMGISYTESICLENYNIWYSRQEMKYS